MPSIDVNDVLKRTQGTGDGSNASFSFAFQVNNTNEIKVYEDSTLKSEGVHYDIVDSSNNAGLNANGTGVVKFKTSPTDYTPANGKKITILSVMSLARSSVYTSGGNITAGSLETDFDRLHRIAGDFKEVKSRTLVAPEHDATDINMTLPKEADRANSLLYFDSDGNPTVTSLITTLSVGTGVVFEGSTADEFETTLTVADPSGSDKTITLPNATGTVSLLTNTETLTNKTLTSPVLNTGVSGTAIKDEDNMSSNSATHLATQQSIKAYVDSQVSASDLDLKGDDDVALSIDLDSDVLDIAGGDGIDTSGSSTTLTVAIDSTVVTLAGTQTLTNKTLERPTMNTGTSGGAGNSVLIGFNAGSNAGSSHTYNVGIGYEAFAQMGTNSSNQFNVGIGYYALHDDGSNTNAHNVAIGNSALKFVDGAISNIGIGFQSLMASNSSNKLEGDYNIAIGHEAGEGVTTGSGNILIGYEANASSNTATNELVIKTYDGSDAVTYLTGSASGTTGTITIPGNLTVNGTTNLSILTATTQSPNDNSTKVATTAYVDAQVATENTLAEMDDVTITSVADNEILAYDSASSKFINQTPAEAGILTGNETITLSGDVSGSGTTSIAVTIADDSHNHTIANVDNLQTSLDAKASLSGATFTGDVTFTGDNYNVVWDKSEDQLEFAEGTKASFGNAGDFKIYHSSGNSYIANYDGDINITNTDNDKDIKLNTDDGAGNTTTYILADGSTGEVHLNYDGITKLETKTTGIEVTGTVIDDGATHDGDVTFTGANANAIWDKSADLFRVNDNGYIALGTSSDLYLIHQGDNSYVVNATGNLYITNGADDKDIIIRSDNGSGGVAEYVVADGSEGEVKLYHASSGSSSIKLTTKSTGVDVTGDLTLTSTDDTNNANPSLILYRNSASPDDQDYIGQMFFKGRNWDGSATVHDVDYAKIMAKATDVTDGTEDGNLEFYVAQNSNNSQRLVFKGNGMTTFSNKDVLLNTNVNLVFEGATANDFETTLTVTDPTQDNTLTLPDASGTVATTSKAIALAMLFG